MDGSVRVARRAAVAMIAAASVFVGLLLIWYFIRPGVIRNVTTPHMLVLLGLFLMPVVTLAAWEMERRARAAAPVESGAGGEADEPQVEQITVRLIRHTEPAAHSVPRRLSKAAKEHRPMDGARARREAAGAATAD